MCPVECVIFVDIHVEVSILIDENYLGEYRLPKHGSGRFLFWFAFFILLIFCLFVCFIPPSPLSRTLLSMEKKKIGCQLKETKSVFAMPMRVPKGNC